MTIEIQMTKEISNYKAKFIGPLTMRQTFCFVLAAIVCVLLFNYAAPIITKEVTLCLCLIPAAMAAAFGWLEPYGMTMEKFVQSVFINMVLAPHNRKYKTENNFSFSIEELDHAFSDGAENAEQISDGEKKKKKNKKKKYKLSSEAVK